MGVSGVASLDPTIAVALVSAAGIVISASFGVLVAVITNRKETTGSAENAAEQAANKAHEEQEDALRERLLLRDEQIVALKLKNAELEAENARLKRDGDTS